MKEKFLTPDSSTRHTYFDSERAVTKKSVSFARNNNRNSFKQHNNSYLTHIEEDMNTQQDSSSDTSFKSKHTVEFVRTNSPLSPSNGRQVHLVSSKMFVYK